MEKIKRDAFLYLEPHKGEAKDFAQCSSCRQFLAKEKLCCILGPNVTVNPGDSCGLYVPGGTSVAPGIEDARACVTPEEAGLVRRDVRCENCAHYDRKESDCELFEKLNETLPGLFDLKKKVSARGCCNAQTRKGANWSTPGWLV